MFAGVNFLAVVVIAAVIFFFAFVYYGPILGKQWRKYAEFSKEKQKKNQNRCMIPSMFLGYLSTLITVLVLAILLQKTNANSVNDTILISVMVWLGFYVTTALGSFLWEMKSIKLWLINSLYNLIMILGAGFGLFLWN